IGAYLDDHWCLLRVPWRPDVRPGPEPVNWSPQIMLGSVMQDDLLQVPDKVRSRAMLLGEPGRAWLAGLPAHIAEIEQSWNIKVGQSFRNGTEAFVAEARASDGQAVVLKAVMPGVDPVRQELRTLRAAAGKGYAKLIRADEATNTMLIE